MALLSRLQDLISKNIPRYAPTSARTVPIFGPEGEDYSLDEEEDPDGPLRRVGERRVTKPGVSRFAAMLPDLISSGVNAAAHVNTAGGGAPDFFAALQEAGQANERKQQLGLQNRRQATQDALAVRRDDMAEREYNRRVAGDERTTAHQQDVEKRLTSTNEQSAVNDAIAKGAKLIPPQSLPRLSPEQRGMVRQVGQSYLLYPSETEQFQKGRVKVTVPEDMQKQFGLPAEHYVKPEELDSWITAIKSKAPNLAFERYEDKVSGDVTVIGRDQATGKEAFRSVEKGISRERPPQAQTHGSYQPIYDEYGNIKSFFNPLTNDNKPAPEGARKPLSEAALSARAALEGSIADAEELERLGDKHQKHMGVVKGRLSDVERKTLGVDESINDMFRIADDLADKLLRARSGAAITEGEYNRLRALMPDPRSPYVKFKSDLRLYLQDVRRTYKSKTGKDAPGHPAATAGSGAVEEWTRDASGKLVKK